MQKVIISDTSCLITLSKIGALDLLQKLFGSVTVTPEVLSEFEESLPDWINVKEPSNRNYQRILQTTLDLGEASSIALAIESGDCLLIIDEYKGRKFAMSLGLKITGTLGILVLAKQLGYISTVKAFLDKIKLTNFRLRDELIQSVLKQAGEL